MRLAKITEEQRRRIAVLGLFAALVGVALTNSASGGKSEDDGVIRGYKFNDLNSDGHDNLEPRISGVTILLNGLDDPSVFKTTITDSEGEFSFSDLRSQRYSVCEVSVPPMVPTTPECVEVNLLGKDDKKLIIFGNHKPEPSPSPGPSPSPSPGPSPTPNGCVRTQGFWGSSPAGQALLPILVPGTLSLGSAGYTAPQLHQILGEPVGGNAILILSDQLIAARLNLLAGASGSSVASTISAADGAIGALSIPPIGSAFVAPGSTLGQMMVSLGSDLDQYNNGNLSVPHCP